jgi:hypothetical protein
MGEKIKEAMCYYWKNISESFNRSFLVVFLILFGGTYVFFPSFFDLVFTSLQEAYLGVGVFVGMTLFLFYGAEYFLNIDTEKFFKKHKKWHVPIAAALGVLPGCGGAVMVMTQYASGRLGFGPVVAVLTSTMGDSAFLLLAKAPLDALIIFVLGFVAGVIFGYIVEKIHGTDFLQIKKEEQMGSCNADFRYQIGEKIWLFIFLPAVIFGFLEAFQYSLDEHIGFPLVGTVAFLGGFLSLVLWGTSPYATPKVCTSTENKNQLFGQIIFDTNFVFVWVFLAFFIFDASVLLTGVSFENFFAGAAIFMPLIGTLVGFLPGCGPQVVLTTFYLQGLIPFSAQVANALSNDGDALFPALALAPKAAIYATLYTAIPALIIGYGWYFLFE